MPEEICEAHHDITILPNGNFLAICSEVRSQEEAINAGLQGIQGPFELDMVVEIQPIGNSEAEIVWEWRFLGSSSTKYRSAIFINLRRIVRSS